MATTLLALAGQLAERYDLTRGTAVDALANFVPQIEALDGTTIDEGNVTDAQADGLTAAFDDWLGNDTPQRVDELLDTVMSTASELQRAQTEAEMFAGLRDNSVRDALAAGATVADVARCAGLSRTSVYKIRDRR